MAKIKKFKVNASTTIWTTPNSKVNDDTDKIIISGEYKKENKKIEGSVEIPKSKIDFVEIVEDEKEKEDE